MPSELKESISIIDFNFFFILYKSLSISKTIDFKSSKEINGIGLKELSSNSVKCLIQIVLLNISFSVNHKANANII